MKNLNVFINNIIENKNNPKIYHFDEGFPVGDKRVQIKDNNELIKYLNIWKTKYDVVIMLMTNFLGYTSDAVRIGRENGWDVEWQVEQDGTWSTSGQYIKFEKK